MKSSSSARTTEIARAVATLGRGGVISFPTETYYGLGADPFQPAAVERIFVMKGREKSKGILLLVRDAEMLSQIVEEIPEPYSLLMQKFWPGPLTLLFPAGRQVNPLLTAGSGTIGIRISSHPVARQLFGLWHRPITATSANISGEPPADTAAAVRRSFEGNIDCVVDGGTTPGGLCSTIVDYHDGKLVLVRQGQIPFGSIAG